MTPFQEAALALLLLFTLTNFDSYVRDERGALPRWYVLSVVALVVTSFATCFNAVINGVF